MIDGMKYRRIIASVMNTPWAIEPQRLVDIMEVLAYKADGGQMSPEEIAAYVDVQAVVRPRSDNVGGGVAVIGLRGILEHRAEQVNDISGPGGTSMQGFLSRFRDAVTNDSIGAVVIDADTPGGSVDGVPEAAAEIFGARGSKPIVAVANTLAASAGYWLASQADEFVVSPSGKVGSIGVFTAHSDLTEKMAMRGEKVTLVHAGRHKVEGNPFEPLGDEARDHLQGVVNSYYDEFVDAVARGRGVKVGAVTGGFGEGRVVKAGDALKEGMVDRVDTLENVIGRLRVTRRNVPRSASAFEFWK